MNKKVAILISILIACLLSCVLLNEPQVDENGYYPVTVQIKGAALPGSFYEVTVSGSGMEQIGPSFYNAGTTIRLRIPPGDARIFHFKKFSQDSTLIDSSTVIASIGTGKSTVVVNLEKVAYTVTYDGNGQTSGEPPVSQTKVQGVPLTLAATTTLARTGFLFAGWNSAADGSGTGYSPGEIYSVDSSVTLYAQWTEIPIGSFVVTFNSQGGSAVLSQTIDSGNVATEPTAPTLSGYTFGGWFQEAGCLNAWSFTADTVVMDTTLFAKWNEIPVNSFVVTFNTQGGSVITSQTVDSGKVAPEPTAPTRSGHIFGGWFREIGCINAWAFTTDKVIQDTILFAKWTEIPVSSFVVTFNSQGGSVVTSQTVDSGKVAPEPTAPTRSGFTFSGWFREAGCVNAWAFTTDKIVMDTTLFAKWIQIPTYSLTYSGNNHTTGTVPVDANRHLAGTPVAVAENSGTLTKTGHTFTGWSRLANGSGKTYSAGDTLIIAEADVVLYARWVSANANLSALTISSGTLNPSFSPATLSYSIPVPNEVANITITGVQADPSALISANNGVPQSLNVGDNTITLIVTAPDGVSNQSYVITVTRAAKPVEFSNITVNGTSMTVTTTECYLTFNDNVTGLTSANITVTGATKGSLTGSGASWTLPISNITVANGQLISISISSPTGFLISPATKSVAVNVMVTYSITYNGNGNTSGSAPATQTKIHDSPQTVVGKGTLAKTGFNFNGWNTAWNGDGTSYPAGASYSANASVTLYAQWSPWIENGNTLIDPDGNTYTTVTIGTQVWMVGNLKTTRYNDGTQIPLRTDSISWTSLNTTPGYCYYNNDSAANATPYGALYNWYTVNTGLLAPAGWRVPSDADWTLLKDYLNTSGGTILAGGTNTTGFSAYLAGWRYFDGFRDRNLSSYFWTSREYMPPNAWSFYINSGGIPQSDYFTGRYFGLSVRLVRDLN